MKRRIQAVGFLGATAEVSGTDACADAVQKARGGGVGDSGSIDANSIVRRCGGDNVPDGIQPCLITPRYRRHTPGSQAPLTAWQEHGVRGWTPHGNRQFPYSVRQTRGWIGHG